MMVLTIMFWIPDMYIIAKSNAEAYPMKCLLCEDCGWVCERHTENPWKGPHACFAALLNALPRQTPGSAP